MTLISERIRLRPSALALEQPLDRLDVAVIGEKYDQVLLGLNERVVVSHDHLLAAGDCDDAGPLRQLEGLDAPADHAGTVGGPVHDDLDGVRRAAPERMHAHDAAAPRARPARAE